MWKKLLIISFIASSTMVKAQGLSFSYFFPSNGYLSSPVSPFSLRGFGLNFTDFLGVESGFSLYYMGGLDIDNLPFENQEPLVGPHFSLLVPVELAAKIPIGPAQFKLRGGAFAMWHINPRINYGNMDRAFRDHFNYQIANSELNTDNSPGLGWLVGGEVAFKVTKQAALTLGVNYLSGSSVYRLEGEVTGVNQSGQLTNEIINYQNTAIRTEGIEVSIGVILSN